MAKTKSLQSQDHSRVLSLLDRCSASRDVRRNSAERWKGWYEFGTNGSEDSLFNKMHSHISKVGSFIFSPGTVRFEVKLPPAVRKPWWKAAAVARDEFSQFWGESEADINLGMAIEWSLVYGSTILKVQPRDSGFSTGLIMPWDFGVSREDVPDLDQQDTVCHWYTLSIPQVERWVANEPDANSIVSLCEQYSSPDQQKGSRQRLVLSSIQGTFPGGSISGGFPYEPSMDAAETSIVLEPTVEFCDVWERRPFRRKVGKNEQIFEDWLVTTIIYRARMPIAQRRNPDIPNTVKGLSLTLPSSLPFVTIIPRPLPDYFWGRSELRNLTQLQNWKNEYLVKLRSTVEKQMDPPTFFSGIPDVEEASKAMSTPGGKFSSSEPNAKMQPLVPTLTDQTMRTGSLIDSMFADESGIPESISEPAQMPGGIRATGHFSMAAGIGAGRLQKMALVIEKSLASLATMAFHILQRNNTDVMETDEGQKFLFGQIPSSISLSVNAHSAAPIFAEQTQAKATRLLQAGAISLEDYIELEDPPNREELREKSKIIQKNKAEMAEKMMQLQEEKVQAKLLKK